MTGATSLDAVKRKIKFLQEQADCAEEKSERLQRELLAEKSVRGKVSIFLNSHIASCLITVTHLPRVASPFAVCRAPPLERWSPGLRLQLIVLLGAGALRGHTL